MGTKKIGLALGSGSARGWAHIGIIEGLLAMGIKPDIVCGTSIGALVGAAYAADHLERLKKWALLLTKKDVFSFVDFDFLRGGVIGGEKIYNFFKDRVGDLQIEELKLKFGAVSTDLDSGHEIWHRSGCLLDAVRASISIPTVFKPYYLDNRWHVDGGLVNPVPITMCKAMEADIIIAVKLNASIQPVVRQQLKGTDLAGAQLMAQPPLALTSMRMKLRQGYQNGLTTISDFWHNRKRPGMVETMSTAIDIMQDRITRSRLAGEPPDAILTPQLRSFGAFDFHRAAEAIEEGRQCVKRSEAFLQEIVLNAMRGPHAF
jgi:NTE family protein